LSPRRGRILDYRGAIREALEQALAADPRVFVMGEGVDDPDAVFGTTLGLQKRFGPRRVFDTPIAENAMTGVAVGAALAGMRPVLVHMRMDFMLPAMDQLVNHAAKWRAMFGGRFRVPLVVRAVVGRGWGAAAQHSQSLQGLFMHAPGLKVVMPSNPYDAKGLLLAAIADDDPVVFVEHRWLYDDAAPVPRAPYRVPLGRGRVARRGRDVTVVAVSLMVREALAAADALAPEGIGLEVVDPRTLCPLDEGLILRSVRKTGRLLVADTGWRNAGAGAEIAARVAEKAHGFLKAPVCRIATADVPTPAGAALEERFYPSRGTIVAEARRLAGVRRGRRGR